MIWHAHPLFLAAALSLAVAGCGSTEGPADGPPPAADASPMLEPSERDPLGFTGRPVDSDPYTSELDGQGLAEPTDMPN